MSTHMQSFAALSTHEPGAMTPRALVSTHEHDAILL